MATSIKLDLGDVERYASSLGASVDQIPYAISVALNTAMQDARSYLIGVTWPRGVHVRNRAFMGASLTTRGQAARKGDLEVVLYDKLAHDYVVRQAVGGVKSARGGRLAIPTHNVTRTSRGVRADQKPRALPNSFRKGNAIYQVQGRGKNRRTVLMYVLKPSVRVAKHVNMYEDALAIIEKELSEALPAAVVKAMGTRHV